jgi:enoyl-CoA hydratase/carnithine racemase
LVVAASDARFGLTEIRIGLWPYMIFSVVARAVGERKATELALTARIVNAEEACRIGLVDIIAGPGDLYRLSRQLASELALGSAEASGDGLTFVSRRQGPGRDSAAGEFRRKAFKSEDFREGVLAFREKRKPHWPSHKIGERDP